MTQTSAHTRVPSELVGTWHYNWVSWVHQQDPVTGHWLPPTAVDITFVFTPDGQFELRDFRQASSWCTLTTYETASGQFEADQVNVTLSPSRGHIISQSDCRADWNYERDGASPPGTIEWRWVRTRSAARRWCWRGRRGRRTPMCRSRVGSRWRRTATGSTSWTVPPAEPRRLPGMPLLGGGGGRLVLLLSFGELGLALMFGLLPVGLGLVIGHPALFPAGREALFGPGHQAGQAGQGLGLERLRIRHWERAGESA